MNLIKNVIKELGNKQTWRVESLEKSFVTLNSYIQNRQQPRLEVLNKIANILEGDIKDLIVSKK